MRDIAKDAAWLAFGIAFLMSVTPFVLTFAFVGIVSGYLESD